ncbi:hypothetical protein FQN60_018373 [Etheostoma spectabile]|uniref:Uncharacterized protein n=1 Tax=Etheostoma spectabile TaxID=54343 RepID=A0A5J5DI66_9PERO|nr:hypothetical protein FQN60_018373 [Etheostoma spectabile]
MCRPWLQLTLRADGLDQILSQGASYKTNRAHQDGAPEDRFGQPSLIYCGPVWKISSSSPACCMKTLIIYPPEHCRGQKTVPTRSNLKHCEHRKDFSDESLTSCTEKATRLRARKTADEGTLNVGLSEGDSWVLEKDRQRAGGGKFAVIQIGGSVHVAQTWKNSFEH